MAGFDMAGFKFLLLNPVLRALSVCTARSLVWWFLSSQICGRFVHDIGPRYVAWYGPDMARSLLLHDFGVSTALMSVLGICWFVSVAFLEIVADVFRWARIRVRRKVGVHETV